MVIRFQQKDEKKANSQQMGVCVIGEIYQKSVRECARWQIVSTEPLA